MHGRLQVHVRPLQVGRFARPHAGLEDQDCNVLQRLRRRVQVNRLSAMAEHEFPVTLTPEKPDSRYAVQDLPLLRQSAVDASALPVPDSGKRHAQAKVIEAVYDTAVANYRQTALTAFEQVEASLAQLRILAQEAEIVDRAVKAAEQSLAISADPYRGGLTNYLQVITAQTSTLQNQRTAVDILTRRMVASVSLIQALGGGWDASQMPSSRGLLR